MNSYPFGMANTMTIQDNQGNLFWEIEGKPTVPADAGTVRMNPLAFVPNPYCTADVDVQGLTLFDVRIESALAHVLLPNGTQVSIAFSLTAYPWMKNGAQMSNWAPQVNRSLNADLSGRIDPAYNPGFTAVIAVKAGAASNPLTRPCKRVKLRF